MTSALSGARDTGVALVAVGGYGRRELAPYSDLDVVLVHADDVDVSALAHRVWYPIWDAGTALDHSVRSLSTVTEAARDDPRVALGLLDARHLAGDRSLTLRLRADLLAHWRRDAPRQLPELRRIVFARAERMGELAHAAVPDLKESLGGLRDATVLKALVASWLVDVPHSEVERARLQLLDVRDELHALLRRSSDRIPPEAWPDLAERLEMTGAACAQRYVRETGRRVTHLTRLAWRRVDAVLATPASPRRRAPELRRIAPGLAVSAGEVVLDGSTSPVQDPTLLLSAAAEAAERALVLSPATAGRLARAGVALPQPWGEAERNLLTRLLAAGPGLLEIWETLDETGSLDLVLPEWERVRLLPHASLVHRFTVDRHLIETCIEASRLIRQVGRPDVLMIAALLHDIGKGSRQEHSVAGESLAGAVAARMGFGERECALIRRLVRHHLLLPVTATTRDLSDPTTVVHVAMRLVDVETLDLLAALTEADARATSPKAWSSWRAALVAELVARVREAMLGRTPPVRARAAQPAEVAVPSTVRQDHRLVEVAVEPTEHGSSVTMLTGDRVGFIAEAAGALAMQRLGVRAARARTQGDFAVVTWDLADPQPDPAILRQRLEEIRSGALKPEARLRPPATTDLPPTVLVRHEASAEATVIEVRAGDRPGVVYSVCRALAGLGLSVRSAHIDTLGPQAVDVFYLTEPGAGGLSDERAGEAVHAVTRSLSRAATLDA
ncbi:[protein-PII] uridylyltransferase [soil metagenome]